MEFVNLGNTGLKVSRVCLGTMTYGSTEWRDWMLDYDQSKPFIQRAWELGINFFDTADIYSNGESEKILGRAIRELDIPRDRVVIATKVFGPMGKDPNQKGLSRKHIMHAIDASLDRLGLDYVDLYQIHRFDNETPIEETLEALTDIVHSGKALYVGASSMYAWQFSKMLYLAERNGYTRFVTMQNHYNIIYREEQREMIPLCLDQGIGLIPWSPLARGFVTGNRKKDGWGESKRAKSDDFAHDMYYQDSDFAVVDSISKIARKRDLPNAQIALAWLLHQPGVTAPIVGATKMHHLDDAVAATELTLSDDELKALDEHYTPHPVLGNLR